MMCFICTIRNMTSIVVSFFYGHSYVEAMMAQLNGLMTWVSAQGAIWGKGL